MRDTAPCSVDPDMFLSGQPGDIKRSRAICFGCPIRETCLEDTLRLEDQLGETIKGTVGATTQAERVQIHAKRAA